jgi:hypothetical protein
MVETQPPTVKWMEKVVLIRLRYCHKYPHGITEGILAYGN